MSMKDLELFGVKIVPKSFVKKGNIFAVSGPKITHIENLSTGEVTEVVEVIDALIIEKDLT